jgi:hypothetical protein
MNCNASFLRHDYWPGDDQGGIPSPWFLPERQRDVTPPPSSRSTFPFTLKQPLGLFSSTFCSFENFPHIVTCALPLGRRSLVSYNSFDNITPVAFCKGDLDFDAEK